MLLSTRVASIELIAEGVLSLELRSASGSLLPPFTAGAHIDLHLANGLVRSYSLTNNQDERHRYVIAVSRDPVSRGGSAYIHERVNRGDVLSVGAPNNNFALAEDAAHSLFIVGGIGITPVWSMIQRLVALERRWTLYYCARTRKHAAFFEQLEGLRCERSANISFHFDDEAAGQFLDVQSIVATADASADLYCCGPTSMLQAFERAAAQRPSSRVHLEYFGNKSSGAKGGFTVVLARSKTTLAVAPGKSILATLIENGFDVPHSCQEGICGTCETRVLEGVPDHRDLVLSEEARQANQTMMICCSGSQSEKLVLDL